MDGGAAMSATKPARRSFLVGLAAFVQALYSATAGKPGRFRSIADCARRAGIADAGDIVTAWSTAEDAGFLVVHVDEPMVMLTSQGRASVQPSNGGR